MFGRAAQRRKADFFTKLIKEKTVLAKYELPFSKIREIIDRYETSPPLARGWELRQLMSNLSSVVEPVKKDRPYTSDQPIARLENPPPFHVGLADLARQHFKRNSTLQSLAIRIYLEQLQKAGITDEGEAITDRTLKRDLVRVREWESTATEIDKLRRGRWMGISLTDDPIIWYEFSEGWKERKKKRAILAKGSTGKKLLKS